jgi:hypothetical protein
MAYYQSPIAFQLQSFTNQGVILAGGKIYTYTAGTTTPVATYADSGGAVTNANPIILDSSGRLTTSVWTLSGVSIKVLIRDSNNNLLATVDNISSINDVAVLSLGSPPAIGNVVPNTGAFTTLSATTSLTATTTALTTLTVSSTSTLAGVGCTTLAASGNVTLGNALTDTLAVTAIAGFGTTALTNSQVIIRGSGTGSATNTLRNQNSAFFQTFLVRDDGLISTGSDATLTFAPYNYTTGAAANMVINNVGAMLRSTSSRRYKHNIQDAQHGLADILKLRPVTYQGNNDGAITFGGFIAEEVHEAGLTEFVSYNDSGQPDALYYGNMVSVMAKGIQELSARVVALETQLAALQSAPPAATTDSGTPGLI